MGVITKKNFVQNFKNLTAPSATSEGPGLGQPGGDRRPTIISLEWGWETPF